MNPLMHRHDNSHQVVLCKQCNNIIAKYVCTVATSYIMDALIINYIDTYYVCVCSIPSYLKHLITELLFHFAICIVLVERDWSRIMYLANYVMCKYVHV